MTDRAEALRKWAEANGYHPADPVYDKADVEVEIRARLDDAQDDVPARSEALRWIALGQTGSYGSAQEFAKAILETTQDAPDPDPPTPDAELQSDQENAPVAPEVTGARKRGENNEGEKVYDVVIAMTETQKQRFGEDMAVLQRAYGTRSLTGTLLRATGSAVSSVRRKDPK